MLFLSIAETADLLNISTKQGNSLIRSGQLQAYQFGQEIRVEEETLKQFIERSKIMSNSNDINMLIMQAIEKASTYEAACESVQQLLVDMQGTHPRNAEGESCRLVMKSEHGKKLFAATPEARMKAGRIPY